MNLSASEIRVLGCLMEKQRTTPDQYPLSLNALRLACNQSTNREPVVDYDDAILRDALHRLERRGYTRFASGAGSRTPKYRHLLEEALPMASDEQAVMCVLMLRGPQTPGELKQRAERMHSYGELAEVHETLERLIARELAARLERRPGQKEERYIQLLEDHDADAAGSSTPHAAPTAGFSTQHAGPTAGFSTPHAAAAAGNISLSPAAGAARQAGPVESAHSPDESASAALEVLEQRVARLERELAQLRGALGEPAASSESAEDRPAEGGGEAAEALAREPAHSGWPQRPNGFTHS